MSAARGATAPARLPPPPTEGSEASFDGLRARGLALLQQLGGGIWTDHNLHDPGITLLEQLCHGLTDIVYRAGFPVADHLTGPDGVIDYEALSLHPPAEVFPCRPTTLADYRRHLLDAVPGLDDATLVPDVEAGGDGRGIGVYRLRLNLARDTGGGRNGSNGSNGGSGGGATPDDPRIAEARAAYFARRNLGEDLHHEVTCMKEVACDLQADIDIAGPRDGVDILAEVYDRCARHIAGAAVSRTLDELLRSGRSMEDIYTGPALRNGFIEDPPPREMRGNVEHLFLSDLTSVVMSVPGVVDARVIALRPAGSDADADGHGTGPAMAGSIGWRGGDWALSLRLPDRDVPSTITVRRRGNVVPVAWNDLRRRLEDLRSAGRAHRARGRTEQAARAAELLPRGVHRRLDRYTSVQDHLPAIYGVGRHGVSSAAPPQRQARARQLKAYLAMQEQAIAQGLAQLQHLRELFSVAPGARRGLWWQMIGPDAVPGLDRLLLQPPELVADAVYKPFDRSARRKNRALDHLLALHGETYTQNSMRQFLGHLGPEEAEALLLENKATWLRDVVQLTRDRAGGFDPTRPSWEVPGNCGGLQRRASLLLGFKLWHDRPLTRTLQEQRITIAPAPGPAHAPWRLDGDEDAVRLAPPAGHAVQPRDRAQVRDDLQRMPWLRLPMPAGLMRAGQHAARYRLMPVAGSGARRLILGPDEDQRWWLLGEFPDADAARRGAASLRLFLRHLDQESEGLHVVEHVLLRPLRQDGLAHLRLGVPAHFHRLRVTVVLPAWTHRCSQPAFRTFARETLRISCPAHLSLRCLWLDPEPMRRFEEAHAAWLEARLAWSAAPDDARLRTSLDEAACRVIEHIGVDEASTAGGAGGSPGAPGTDGEDDGHGPVVLGHA